VFKLLKILKNAPTCQGQGKTTSRKLKTVNRYRIVAQSGSDPLTIKLSMFESAFQYEVVDLPDYEVPGKVMVCDQATLKSVKKILAQVDQGGWHG
jgi:hypothetical protein